jgi:beta-lactamase regulating signal transducer with metallopeptidase domain
MATVRPDLLTFLLNALWQVPLAAAVAALVCRLLRDGPALHRHAVWVAALIAAVLLPAASLRPHQLSSPFRVDAIELPAPILPGVAATPAPAIPVPASVTRSVSFPRIGANVLGILYLLFLAMRLARFGWAWIRTVRLRRSAVAPVLLPVLESVWQRCCSVFSIRNVELRASERVPSPVTTGSWRKTVILPDALLTESSEAVLTTAIGHEAAHIARHDFALNLLYELLFIPISFHPAAWIIRRGIEGSREMSCDELVTRKLLDPDVYAESMIAIAARMTGLASPGCTLGVFGGDGLEERIRRLLDRRTASVKRARLLLATGLSAFAACAVIASGLALTAHAQSEAQAEMKLGGDAYNSGDFHSAVEHFEKAARSEPTAVRPKLFLANALMREAYAGHAPPDSPLMAAARRQYQDVLVYEPRNIQALQGMVAVAISLKELSAAPEWVARLIEADGSNKTSYYTAGVVAWAIAYPEFQRAKQGAGGRLQDYFISDPAVRTRLREQFQPQVDDGLRMLDTALQLDPQYDDAMAYMNLLYRLKAGLVDNPGESAGLLARADEWVGKALAARRAHPHPAPGSSELDVGGPAPGPAGAQYVAAPPPPPPPPPAPLGAKETRLASASAPPAGPPVPLVGQCWQVMGAADGVPAIDLFRQLRDRGFTAMMHDSPVDHQVRVIAGPYFDQPSLLQARAALTAAGFRIMRLW